MSFRRVLIGVIAVLSAAAQAISPPAFDVASITPSQAGIGRPSMISNPGRWSCTNCTLFALLTQAFTAFDYQTDAPGWTRTAMFDVFAKLPEGAQRGDLKLMVQSFLQERFKMKTHRESREMPVYELVIANGGPKINRVDAPAPLPPPGPEVDPNGFPNAPNGSGMRVLNGRGRIQSRGQTMKVLANYISVYSDRPVLDATGLEGDYPFTLSFPLLRQGGNNLSTVDTADAEFGPTIYEAVEQQLGLKLKPTKRPVEVIVIDHLDRTPIEN